MRRSLFLLFTISAVALSQQAKHWSDSVPIAWGPVSRGWQLAIASEHQGYFSNEPVQIALVVRNTSSTHSTISVQKSPWAVTAFTVRRLSDGKLLAPKPTRDQFDRLERYASGVFSLSVAAGGIARINLVNLAELFDLEPGMYSVRATNKLPGPEKTVTAVATSNEITVSIIGK